MMQHENSPAEAQGADFEPSPECGKGVFSQCTLWPTIWYYLFFDVSLGVRDDRRFGVIKVIKEYLKKIMAPAGFDWVGVVSALPIQPGLFVIIEVFWCVTVKNAPEVSLGVVPILLKNFIDFDRLIFLNVFIKDVVALGVEGFL